MINQEKIGVRISENIQGSDVIVNAVAGTIFKYFGSCFSIFNSSTWMIDSNASKHMCVDSHALIYLSPLACPIDINMPNS